MGFPDGVLTVESDVRDREALESAVNATLVRFGRLDAVVAAAGVVVGGLTQWETPDEHLQTLLDVNVRGVWTTAAVTVPVMLAGPAPASAASSPWPRPPASAGCYKLAGYVASKHAVIGIVRGLAADLVGTGVAAIAVAPGSTDTPMLAATADLYDTTPDGAGRTTGHPPAHRARGDRGHDRPVLLARRGRAQRLGHPRRRRLRMTPAGAEPGVRPPCPARSRGVRRR